MTNNEKRDCHAVFKHIHLIVNCTYVHHVVPSFGMWQYELRELTWSVNKILTVIIIILSVAAIYVAVT